MASVLTRVEDYLHSEIKRGMIKERRERGSVDSPPPASAPAWESARGWGDGRGVRVQLFSGRRSLREQWRNNVQIVVSDAPRAAQVRRHRASAPRRSVSPPGH